MDPPEPAIRHDEQSIPRFRFLEDTFNNPVNIRKEIGRDSPGGERCNKACGVHPGGFIVSFGVKEAGQKNPIRATQRITEPLLELSSLGGIAPRFENREDSTAREPRPRCLNRFPHSGGMVGEVVNDPHSPCHSTYLHSPPDAAKGTHPFANRLRVDAD